MKYTASAIGLLKRQYKSVLKKCFLINMGLFALGVMGATSAHATGLPTPTLGDDSAYEFITKGASKTNYDVNIDSAYALIGLKSTDNIEWSAPLDSAPDGYTWADTNISGSNVTINGDTITGAIRLKMPHNDVAPTTWNRWYTYTYTKPSNYTITQTRLNNNVTADDVDKKVFAGISSGATSGGAIYNTKDLSTVAIIADFVSNNVSYSGSSSAYTLYGGSINTAGTAGTINSVLGNFIGNFAKLSYTGDQSTTVGAVGGAINNSSTINNLTGNFIGNSVYAHYNAGGGANTWGSAIGNYGTIQSVRGDFIGNSNIASGNGSNKAFGTIHNGRATDGTARIYNITGDFLGNFSYASTGHARTSAQGGAISNHAFRGAIISTIDSITGNFINNSTKSYYSFGGAITNIIEYRNNYNNKAEISSIIGDFIGNSASGTKSYGGAIYNGGTSNLSVPGTPYYNDSPTVSNAAKLTLGGNTFTGNYVDNNGKITPNSIYNAGIINIADGATVTVNDGWQSFDNGTNAGQLVMGTGSTLNMNIGNGTIQQDSLGKITNVGTINATFDIDLSNTSSPESDTITVTSVTQEGKINLTGLKFKGDYDTYKNIEFTQRLLINSDTTSNLQLKLALDEITVDDTEYYVLEKGEKTTHSDTFNGTAKWSDTYESYNLSTDTYGNIALASSNDDNVGTKDDSITFTVKGTKENKSDVIVKDSLQTANNNVDHTDKTFTADADGDTYYVTDDLGATKGTLSVNGVADGEAETVDLKGFAGFELGDGATALNLNNVTITDTSDGKTPANTTIAAVTNTSAKINLNNATLNGGIINAGELNINGASSVAGNIIGTGDNATLNVNSDFALSNTVTEHTVNVKNGATLTVASAGSLVASDTLNAVGGTVDLGNNAVNVKSATLDGNSTLALRINSLTDHGSLTATDSITIKDGAKLKATLAQNAGLGDVTLLTATTHTGDFADDDVSHTEDGVTVEDNYMYKFSKKEGEFGVFTIAQKATAEEIAEAAGAEPWAAEAAGAFVDGDAFTPGTVVADVADKMADLAQNNPAGLVEAVKAIAPTETAAVQAQSSEEASRLFKTVDSYLRGERDPMGFASGDDLDGVSVWGKAYIGESKISRRGKIDGSDADSRGLIIGIEKKLNTTTKVGAGMQYDSTDIKAFSRKIDVNSVLGFAYGEYKPSNWFVNGVLSYGGSNYDEKKYALGTQFNAKYDAHVASAAAMTGYQYGIFTPEAGLRYYHIKQSGYTDTAGQSVEGDESDILRGVAGVRMAKDFGQFRPEAYLGITYDLSSDKGNTTVNLANGSSYTVQGKRLDKLGYEASLSFAASLNENITASVSYLGAYRDNYREHTGMFNVKYNF